MGNKDQYHLAGKFRPDNLRVVLYLRLIGRNKSIVNANVKILRHYRSIKYRNSRSQVGLCDDIPQFGFRNKLRNSSSPYL